MFNYLTECTITVINILTVLMKMVSGQYDFSFFLSFFKMAIKRKIK